MCSTYLAFRVFCVHDGQDHTTIAGFRAACEAAFMDLFEQVVTTAALVGLVRLGTVATERTNVTANASIDASRSQAWI